MQEILKGINSKVFLGFCLMLSLFWAWNWVVFQSATVLTIELGSTGITIPCRSVSLGAFSLTSLVIFLAYRKAPRLIERQGMVTPVAPSSIVSTVAD